MVKKRIILNSILSLSKKLIQYTCGMAGHVLPGNVTRALSSIDFSIHCIPPGSLDNCIWHVAALKTGGTWLSVMMQDLFSDYEKKNLGESVGTRQLNPLKVLLYSTYPHQKKTLFVQQHCILCRNTEKFLTQSQCKVIFQTRNIFDSIVSLYDHSMLSSDDDFWTLFGYDKSVWSHLDDEQRLDFLVDFATPWYLKFYCSWFSSEIYRSSQVLTVRYEDLKDDPLTQLCRIVEFTGDSLSNVDIEHAIQTSRKTFTRKNKGIVGRGEKTLTEKQIGKIYSLAEYYTPINLSSIGIC